MIFISSSFGIPLISDNFFAVWSINEGSFFLPLLGTGAKKGLSVSIKILSKGNDLKVFCNSKAFLYVIIPLAEKLLCLDAYFSASGIITFKKSTNLQNTFSSFPLDRILIETDSPFLAPVPNRGKKNEPSFIDFTAAKLAEIKNIEKSEIIKITTNNFNNLFFK